MLGLNVVSVFRSSLKNKVENPTTLKRETEREILIELAIIDTYSKCLQGNISREYIPKSQRMAYRFWKSMPAALKKPTLDGGWPSRH